MLQAEESILGFLDTFYQQLCGGVTTVSDSAGRSEGEKALVLVAQKIGVRFSYSPLA